MAEQSASTLARELARRAWAHVRPEAPFYLAIVGLLLLTLATMNHWGQPAAKP